VKVFRFATLAALSLLLPLFLLPAGANASTLATGTGSFTGTVEVTSITQVGGNTIVEGIEVVHLTGFFTGTRIASGNQIIHADGTTAAHDSGTFTGTVDGRAGTVVISGTSTGSGNTLNGSQVVERGTGALAGLHAQGPFQTVFTSLTTVEGTYSVQYHFDS
jgi:hypothetical protein